VKNSALAWQTPALFGNLPSLKVRNRGDPEAMLTDVALCGSQGGCSAPPHSSAGWLTSLMEGHTPQLTWFPQPPGTLTAPGTALRERSPSLLVGQDATDTAHLLTSRKKLGFLIVVGVPCKI
jgi:hypothetical protein